MKFLVGGQGIKFDDPVLDQRREIDAGQEFWGPPGVLWSMLDSGSISLLDPDDTYGRVVRREFVTAADVANDSLAYTPGCAGQIKWIDEFLGAGRTESLSGKYFRRTTFLYENPALPTEWTTMFDGEHLEP